MASVQDPAERRRNYNQLRVFLRKQDPELVKIDRARHAAAVKRCRLKRKAEGKPMPEAERESRRQAQARWRLKHPRETTKMIRDRAWANYVAEGGLK